MHLRKVTVRNFRLLADTDLVLETPTTLIVGRNNSGKTSLSEAIRRWSCPVFVDGSSLGTQSADWQLLSKWAGDR